MLKFVVIEDDKMQQEKVKSLLRSITFNVDEEVVISMYTKFTTKLKEEINERSGRKIYLIDIELESNYSGVQIAKFIRDSDWESEIIFMTNHDKMFETVYRNVYKVFDFIEKFHLFESRLEKDIRDILKMNFDRQMFVYHGRNLDLHVFLKDILYIYRDTEERKIVVVTNGNKFSVNLSVHETMEMLDDRFKMVHRACIVNIDRVQKFNWSNKCFTLDTGEVVHMLSRKYKKNFDKKR